MQAGEQTEVVLCRIIFGFVSSRTASLAYVLEATRTDGFL